MARYRIVPERSRVWIDARSNVHPIHSSTEGLEGFVDLDVDTGGRIGPSDPPEGQLSLEVSRLSSGNGMEDRELRKRIDARRFPTIHGAITSMKSTGQDGSYAVSGDITFRGVARVSEGMMTLEVVDDRTVTLAGHSRFDIRDFGMEPPRVFILKVEPEVDIRVEIIAEKEG